ncbi:MAG: DUF3343 domain-containing protein [Clostridia bacterium]|nr:DUF3343 domain-containing protein [Clostridia bacterium]
MIYNNSYRTVTVCTAVTVSMTVALKAQRILAKSAIRAEVIKVSSSSAKRGCTYGIEFDYSLLGNVKDILGRSGIDVKEYLC